MDLVIKILKEKKIEIKNDIEWFKNETQDLFLKELIPELKESLIQLDEAINLIENK